MKTRTLVQLPILSTLGFAVALLAGVPAAAAAAAAVPVATPVLGSMLAASTSLEGKLNINEATAAQWELLPGIGPAMAQKLLDYRKQHKFGDLTHVMRIKGIGRKTYEKIKPYLTLEGPSTLREVSGP
jgi:competence protein ComEA